MNKKINVLVISRMYPSIAKQISGTFVHDQVKALAENENCGITVISPKPFFPAVARKLMPQWKNYPEIPLVEDENGIRVYYPKYLSVGGDSFHVMKGLLMPWTLRKFMRTLRENEFDVIHVHMSFFHDGWLAKEIKRKFGKKMVITVHGSASIYPSQRRRRFFMRKTLEKADRIIAVSGFLKKEVLRYGFDEKQVVVIGNGAFSAHFHPMEKKYARNVLNLPTDAKIIVCVATLIEAKGQQELISALSIVTRSMPKVLLVLIGADVIKQALVQQAQVLGLIDSIIFAGPKPHEKIPLWLNASDLFVLPSHQEGMPVSLLEALMCGKPVIATAVGGIPEVMTSPEYGILVAPRNVAQLSQALLEGLSKDWREDRIAQYGARFTWEAVAKRIRGIYEDVLT